MDYGAGNLRSVAKALLRSGLDARVTSDPADVVRADAVVLPGVGAFADAASRLRESGLEDAVKQSIEAGRPYLGLCFGLQLLFDESDEHGVTRGFQMLRGRVERFPKFDTDGSRLRVPHIGWNEVRFSGSHPILERLPERETYYVVHSYRPVPTDDSIVVGRADYGGEFAAAVATPSVFAVQFHPEKSQAAGKRLLDAFGAWVETTR
ncbi:MAG: imidazole glycerol phosphate synthase subunit HisH [Deltaproteobacteria bacterium]|nr:imidazole glycerol phosphate synthase subunit HisH [Deltaproteobacteria bacterium]